MRKCIVLLIYGIAIVSGFGQTPEKDQLGSKIDFFEFGISSDSFIVSNQALSFECAKFLGISKLSGVNLVPVNYQKNAPIKLYQVEAFRGSDTFNLAFLPRPVFPHNLISTSPRRARVFFDPAQRT